MLQAATSPVEQVVSDRIEILLQRVCLGGSEIGRRRRTTSGPLVEMAYDEQASLELMRGRSSVA